jgi:hypothetical protein
MIISVYLINQSTKLQFFATVWTIEKSFVDRIHAEFAQQPGLFLIRRWIPFEFIFRSVTTLANGERLAFFDSQNRDKKDVQVMVNPRLIGLLQTTDSTSSRVILNYFGFGGYTGNEKKHGQRSRVKGFPS